MNRKTDEDASDPTIHGCRYLFRSGYEATTLWFSIAVILTVSIAVICILNVYGNNIVWNIDAGTQAASTLIAWACTALSFYADKDSEKKKKEEMEEREERKKAIQKRRNRFSVLRS